jgi:hypothetical protein
MAHVVDQVQGIEHRFVDAAGLRMHVVEAGPPDGDPVLVLHGRSTGTSGATRSQRWPAPAIA